MKRIAILILFAAALCGHSFAAIGDCAAGSLPQVINTNWKLIDCNASFNQSNPFSLGLVHSSAVNAHDTIVVMCDADTPPGITGLTITVTDNATGNSFSPLPQTNFGFSNTACGTSNCTVFGNYYIVFNSVAKASGYQATCTATKTGGTINDLDAGIALYRQTGGGGSPGLDTSAPWTSNLSSTSGTTSAGCVQASTCYLDTASAGTSISLSYANDLIIAGGNSAGTTDILPFASSPSSSSLGCDGDGAGTGFVNSIYYSGCSTYAGTGSISYTAYDDSPGIGFSNTIFAIRPTASGSISGQFPRNQ